MKKKAIVLIALVSVVSLMLAACGSAGTAETVTPEGKQVASAILINDGNVVADAIINISDGYSVHVDWNGISLIEGEYSNLAYPLVSIVTPADGVYERIVAEYKDKESFHEVDGVMKFIDSINELNYVFMLEDKVPISISFEEGVDEARADEIMSLIELTAR